MGRKRFTEVTGKPTQYNLQTRTYDWRELPNTHYIIPTVDHDHCVTYAPVGDCAADCAADCCCGSCCHGDVTCPHACGHDCSHVCPHSCIHASVKAPTVDFSEFLQWNHNDIRRTLQSNVAEVGRCYLHGCEA